MPRPKKFRKVCCVPEINKFGPLKNGCTDKVYMSVEEYETIRLIDNEGLKQDECAKRMNVARTTVQGIYDDARKKLADSLINGKLLIIEGGNYRVCDGNGRFCGRNCRRRRGRNFESVNNDNNENLEESSNKKNNNNSERSDIVEL